MADNEPNPEDFQEFLRRMLSNQGGGDIDPEALAGSLSVGYMQIVEIAKALSKNARILVMDEPTSSLSESETEALFQLPHTFPLTD